MSDTAARRQQRRSGGVRRVGDRRTPPSPAEVQRALHALMRIAIDLLQDAGEISVVSPTWLQEHLRSGN